MTFEEFLIKKKIDPAQLQNADQAFFDEFKSHFEQMGEKSFDHSKKFWFNKLRRAYPLAEEVKIEVAEVKTVTEVRNSVAEVLDPSVAEALEAPSLQVKPAFKPRFKANIAASTTELKQESQGSSTKSAENKSNTNTTDSQTDSIEPSAEAIEAKTTDAQPAFKPRFKPSMLKKDPKID